MLSPLSLPEQPEGSAPPPLSSTTHQSGLSLLLLLLLLPMLDMDMDSHTMDLPLPTSLPSVMLILLSLLAPPESSPLLLLSSTTLLSGLSLPLLLPMLDMVWDSHTMDFLLPTSLPSVMLRLILN